MGRADRPLITRASRRLVTVMGAVIGLLVSTLALSAAPIAQAGAALPKAVYIAGTNGPPSGDKPAVELIEELGFDVIVLDDDTPNLQSIASSFTPVVIVISSSVTPNKIGDMFTSTPTPVVTWEPYVFDDLGLTNSGAGARGEAASAKSINVIDGTHPITAPLSGIVNVTSANRPITYGVPGGDVQALANVLGSGSRAAILVAETGDELANGDPAPGARVGLFMSWSSPPKLTNDGAALVGKAVSWAADFVPPAPNLAPVVDAGPDQTIMLPDDTAALDATVTDDSVVLVDPIVSWTGPTGVTFGDANAVDTTASFPGAGTFVLTITANDGELQTSDDVQITVQDPAAPAGTNVLFVIGSAANLAANDLVVEAKLIAAGLDITRVDDDALPTDLDGVDGIVISTSINSGKVGTAFTDIDLPILTWEGYLLDELGLSDGPNGETPKARRTINIVDPAHPLAAGLSGYTSVLTGSRRMSYATPGAGAEVVAFDGSPNANRAVLFAYVTDAPLPGGGTAPARRVVVFPNYGGSGLLSSFGMDIMDAAIAFFLVPDNEPPTVDDQGLDVDENSPNGTVVGQIVFDDPDLPAGDVVTVSVDGGTGNSVFDVSDDGEVTVSDAVQLDHETTPSFTLDVTVTDEAGESDSATVTIAVDDVNDAPDAVDDGFGGTSAGTGGAATSLVGNDTDQDGDPLEIVATSVGPLGTASPVTSAGGRSAMVTISDAEPQYQVVIDDNFRDLGVGESDTITVTYTVADPGGLTDTADVLVTIFGANDDPIAVDDAFDVDQDVVLSEDLLANDTDPDIGDTLEIQEIEGNGPGSEFTVQSAGGRDGTVRFLGGEMNVEFDQDGNFQDLADGETDTVVFSYVVEDGSGATDTGSVTITVNGVNDAPVALDDFVDTAANAGFAADPLFNDSDPDGDAFFLSSVGGLAPGTSGTVTTTGGRTASFSSVAGVQGVSRIIFPPGQGVFDDLEAGEFDQVVITYSISDGNGGVASAMLTVTVDGVD